MRKTIMGINDNYDDLLRKKVRKIKCDDYIGYWADDNFYFSDKECDDTKTKNEHKEKHKKQIKEIKEKNKLISKKDLKVKFNVFKLQKSTNEKSGQSVKKIIPILKNILKHSIKKSKKIKHKHVKQEEIAENDMKCGHGQNLRVVYCKWAYLSHLVEMDNCKKRDEFSEEEELLVEDEFNEENEEEMMEEVEEEEIMEEDPEEESVEEEDEEIPEEESVEKVEVEEIILPEKEDKETQFNRPFEEHILCKGVNLVWYGRLESYLSPDETDVEEQTEENLLKRRRSSGSKYESRESDSKKMKDGKKSKLTISTTKKSNTKKSADKKKGAQASTEEGLDPNTGEETKHVSDDNENEKSAEDSKSKVASDKKYPSDKIENNTNSGRQEIDEFDDIDAPFNIFQLPEIKTLMREMDMMSQIKLREEFYKLASEGKVIIQPWNETDTSIIDIDSLFAHDKVKLTGSWFSKLLRFDKIDIRERNRRINILNKGLLRIRTQSEKKYIKRMDALNINKPTTSILKGECDIYEKKDAKECEEFSVVRSQHKIYNEVVNKEDNLPRWNKRIFTGTSRVSIGEESWITWDKHLVSVNKDDFICSEDEFTKIDDDDYSDTYDNEKKEELCKKISTKFVKYLQMCCKNDHDKKLQDLTAESKNNGLEDEGSVDDDCDYEDIDTNDNEEPNKENRYETSGESKRSKDNSREDYESEDNGEKDNCKDAEDNSGNDETDKGSYDDDYDYKDTDTNDNEEESDQEKNQHQHSGDSDSGECLCYEDHPDRELIETCLTLIETDELRDEEDVYSCRVDETN